MLNIYVYNLPGSAEGVVPNELYLVTDVEEDFNKVYFDADDINKKLVHEIDGGTLQDRYSALDRFGYKIHTSQLSSGCKAALIINNSTFVVDLLECSNNTIGTIFSFCDGNVAIPLPSTGYGEYSGTEDKEFIVNGKKCIGINQAMETIFYGHK